jgi:hypothetical protein
MAKKWLIGGLAVGVGALVAVPDARTWLRRRLGLEPEDRRWFEEEGIDAPEYEGDEPLDTREARFSLRARLSEDGPAEPVAPVVRAPFEAAAEPEPAPTVAEATPEPDPFPAAPVPEPEPYAPPAAPEPAPFGSMTTPEPYAPPAAPEPQANPEPEPAPWPSAEPAHSLEPESTPFTPPERETGYRAYESVPSIVPEADAPKTPGEDTDEVGPLPPVSSWEPPAAPPPPPPIELRPPLDPPNRPFPSRPFSSEGASFRSAIDAARERVHGAAREATPDEDDGTEPVDENAS